MTERFVVLIGGGGHALVVAEAAMLAGARVLGFLDDDQSAVLAVGAGAVPRLGGMTEATAIAPKASWIIAIGDLKRRRELIGRFLQGATVAVVHPSASVSATATLGEGTYIGPQAVVHARASIGAHAIINSGAIVEHECRVGENVHVAPGAILGGRASVGADTLVGLGARVLPGIRIGRACVIGAGSVVLENLPDGMVVAGVPAQAI